MTASLISDLMQRGRCVMVQAIKRVALQITNPDQLAIKQAFLDDAASPAELRLYDLRKARAEMAVVPALINDFMAVILGLTPDDPVVFFSPTAEETHERATRVVVAIAGPLVRQIDLDDPELGPMRECAKCKQKTPVDEGMSCGECGAHVCQPCFQGNGSCGAATCAPMVRG